MRVGYTKTMIFELSRCKSFWLHKFDLVAEYHHPNTAVKERCARCGKEVIFKIDSRGLADNNLYLKYHARQALVPQHSLFAHEYPDYGKLR